MKINDKRKEAPKELNYSDLENGDCFEWITEPIDGDEGICIKITAPYTRSDYYSIKRKCVYDSQANEDKNVILLNATLVICRDY